MKRGLTVIALLLCLGLWLWSAQGSRANLTSGADLQEVTELWQGSAHAFAEVNCSSCHQDEQQQFVAVPTYESCRSCHETAVETFLLGKHGIRLLEGESPLTPAMAHLPMQPESRDLTMTCATCHNVHSVNTYTAAVDACLTCHADPHSLNYKNSKHAQLWQAEGTLPRPSSQSTTCATCHLPRQNLGTKKKPNVVVNHNNTYTLLPRDRMVKEVCMNCHGMEYAYNSIFDDELVTSNFARPPNDGDLQTLEMVRALEKSRSGK